MEIIFHIKSGFKCVYLLNGSFVEHADTVKYNDKEPLYITALPLNAHHLPYTVKLLASKALSNEQLAAVYTLEDNRFFVKLMPRYNYVYSPSHKEPAVSTDGIELFFFNIKQGNLTAARGRMTSELSESIADEDLKTFFNDYTDILLNSFTGNAENTYFLIDKHDRGTLFKFQLSGNLIDNIVQL